MKVCILAAGLGTRVGPISEKLHKALLPLGKGTVISKIIERFPQGTEFVIATGNKADQVISFLPMAHPEIKFDFIEVDPYQGPGSGPGFSLYSCKSSLQEPFVFMACDTLILNDLPSFDHNWISVAQVNDPESWCMADLDGEMAVSGLEYKNKTSKLKWAFSGMAFVQDYEDFWNGFPDHGGKTEEIQVNDGLLAICEKGLYGRELTWLDTGQWESYQEALTHYEKGLTFPGKSTEYTYLYGDRILKLYDSEEKAARFFQRGQGLGGSTPQLFEQIGPVLSLEFIEGELLSKSLNGKLCADFLEFMEREFWLNEDVDLEKFAQATREFYIDKSVGRLEAFYEKFAEMKPLAHAPVSINGKVCQPPIESIMKIQESIVSQALPSRFHGDLHGDNVLVSRQGEYSLIDWRESYSGLSYGDRYYDFGKFLHTLDFSVKAMESGQFSVKSEGSALELSISNEIESRAAEARAEFLNFLQKYDYDIPRTELINALTFLNMCPLYEGSLALYLYYLGCYKLQDSIDNSQETGK